MVKKFKSLLLLLLVQVTLLTFPCGLQAQLDPSIHWKEIETDTAYWLFDAKHHEVAEYYIAQFERARQKLMPIFKEEPRKATILLLDNTDRANGSAQVTPHPIISLFLVQPSPYSSIGEFRDYVHELIAHEYTHILNMEPVHGWMSPLYWVFGSVAHPNMILPRWYTEGLAVYTESSLSKTGGRLNSQYLQGLARALSLESKWEKFPLSELNDGKLDWLGNSRAYLFGGILWESINRQKGEEHIYYFNQSYSRRVPFFLDGVIESYLGVDYQEQLARAYEYWEQKALEQIRVITSAPQLNGRQLRLAENSTYFAPSISPDGLWMAFISSSPEGQGNIELSLRHPRKGFLGYKPKTVVKRASARTVAWHPAATGFVYEKLDRYKLYNFYYDLYFYDLQTKKSKRLTRGLRAHSACFSPLGKNLYFLSNTASAKKVMQMNWLTQKTKTLYQGSIGHTLNHLTCSDDGKVYFVEQVPGQDSQIMQLDVKTKRKQSFYAEKDVRFLKKVRQGFLISSPDSGVDNIYILKNGQTKAITNSITRALKAELDPLNDGLYYSQLTSGGPQLFYLKGAQWESLPDNPPKVKSIFQSPHKSTEPAKLAETEVSSEQAQPKLQIKKHQADDFSPWRYMYPNHWIPFLYFVDGGTLYQAMTSAGDPLGINNISLIGQWDTLTRKAGASLSYTNNSFPFTWGVGLSDFYNWFYATQSTLHFSNAGVFIGKNFQSLAGAGMFFRWNYSQLEQPTDILIRQGPQLEIRYRSTKRKASDISPSEGWRSELGHRNFLADLGNQSYGETYAHLGTFWSSFTPKRHVFYLGLNGSYAPKLVSSFFASSTLAGPFINPQITNTSFLQRGYPTGNFLAKNILNANAEYRFPIWTAFSGWTAPPLFLKNLQGSFVFDATTIDGRYRDSLTNSSPFSEFGRWFTGYGLELESNVNVGFHVPVTLTLGFYYGADDRASGGFSTFFNIRL